MGVQVSEETFVLFEDASNFFIGDTEGQDKLVGKFMNRSNNVACLCHYCECPTEATNNIAYRFKYVQQMHVETLTRKKQKESLKKMFHHMIENHALYRLQFCDPKRGIRGYPVTPRLKQFTQFNLAGMFI